MNETRREPLVSVVIPTHDRKEKVVRLIDSILNNSYKKIEVIVVDDASSDGTHQIIRSKFPQVKIIRNKKEKLLAASRNVGILSSKGPFIFLIDDDNVVSPDTINELVKRMLCDSKIGVAGPLMYFQKDPRRIWCAGIKRSYVTSVTRFIGRGAIDNGQYVASVASEEFPNAFIVRSEVFKKIGLFDEKNYPLHYGEADFCRRAEKSGYGIVTAPKAKVWHDTPLQPKEVSIKGTRPNLRRAYYYGRNRIVFHRKYSRRIEFILFILLFEPFLIIPLYLAVLIFSGERNSKSFVLAQRYVRGVVDGLSNRIQEVM